jgi:uncharacterized membrane protein
MKLRVVLGLFVLGQVLDGLLTFIGLNTGYSEGNPVANVVFPLLGPTIGIITLKLFGCFCGYVLYRLKSYHSLVGLTIYQWCVGVFTWVFAFLGVW